MSRSQCGELVEFDPEIKRTLLKFRCTIRYETMAKIEEEKALEKQLEDATMAQRWSISLAHPSRELY